MNKAELIRKLNSVGKAAFVEHFLLLRSYANRNILREQCIDSLVAEGISNEAGASIRTSNALLIFRSHKEYEALALVAKSTRVPANIVRAAQKLLKERS